MLHPAGAALATAARLLAAPGEAAADEASIPVRLDYAADAPCPTRDAFFEEIRTRAPRIRAAGDGEAAYAVRVDVTAIAARGADGPGLAGKIALVDLDGNKSFRTIEGTACEDIALALALVVALDVTGMAVVPPTTPSIAPAPDARPPARDLATAAAGPRWLPDVALLGGARTGVAPVLAPAGILSVGLEHTSLWRPVLRISASYASADTAGSNDTVTLRLATVAADGCSARARFFEGRVTLIPCLRAEAGFHLGEIHPNGLGIAGAPWFALGAVGQAHLILLEGVFAVVEVSGLFPTWRTRFLEGSSTSSVFSSPSFVAGGAGGVGVTF